MSDPVDPVEIYIYCRDTRSIRRLVERARWIVEGVVVVKLVDGRDGSVPPAPFFDLRDRQRHGSLAAAQLAILGHW